MLLIAVTCGESAELELDPNQVFRGMGRSGKLTWARGGGRIQCFHASRMHSLCRRMYVHSLCAGPQRGIQDTWQMVSPGSGSPASAASPSLRRVQPLRQAASPCCLRLFHACMHPMGMRTQLAAAKGRQSPRSSLALDDRRYVKNESGTARAGTLPLMQNVK